MRIATSMIFDQGVRSINAQTSTLLHTQQQISANTRLLRPSDDPVATARALEVTQAKDVTAQFTTNQSYAQSALGLEESHLSSANDLLTRIRELAVQAGNAGVTTNDRKSISTELRSRFDELVGMANATDGNGQYIFSGYMGSTKPFAASIDAMIQNPALEATYQGDSGQRQLQVSASRNLQISDSGQSIFMDVPSGNGYFTTTYVSTNTGSGLIDDGSVTNPAAWAASGTQNVQVKMWVDTNGLAGAAGKTYYDLIDTATNTSLITGAAPQSPTATTFPSGLRQYSAGLSIPLSKQATDSNPGTFDLGSSIVISGTPANGDGFDIAPSTNKSIFRTVADLVSSLESSKTGAAFTIDINSAIANVDQTAESVLEARAGIGTRLNELDFLGSVNTDLNLQYQQTLSNLQDLDYAKAISDLTRQQTNLQASQLSFSKINQLTLFDYIK